MTISVRGRLRGRIIELEEDPGIPEGQEIQVQIQVIPENRSDKDDAKTESASRVYSILDERYESGYTDTAARHDEHQP